VEADIVAHPNTIPEVVIAVDPGREKCGVAVVRADGRVLSQAVVATGDVAETVARALEADARARVILGNRTGARDVSAALRERCRVTPTAVDEHHSTLQGRRRYFAENPPRGWRRLLPVGLQTPPHPYDDYVAVVLAERYLASLHGR